MMKYAYSTHELHHFEEIAHTQETEFWTQNDHEKMMIYYMKTGYCSLTE